MNHEPATATVSTARLASFAMSPSIGQQAAPREEGSLALTEQHKLPKITENRAPRDVAMASKTR
jgi:hypothetical protein